MIRDRAHLGQLLSRMEDAGIITGYRATVDTPYQNLGALQTAGWDLSLNWGFDVAGGAMNLTSVFNYLDYYRDQQSPTAPFIDATGTLLRGGQFANGDLPEVYKLRLGARNYHADFELRASSVENPYNLKMFARFTCPEKI